jgi:hypothetical protein
MADKPTLEGLKAALGQERRASSRLRSVIEDLGVAVQTNRRDLDVQFARIAQLQSELDLVKKRTADVARLPPCPPCPRCWSSGAVRFIAATAVGSYCRCERCATVWVHDDQRLAAILRDEGFPVTPPD